MLLLPFSVSCHLCLQPTNLVRLLLLLSSNASESSNSGSNSGSGSEERYTGTSICLAKRKGGVGGGSGILLILACVPFILLPTHKPVSPTVMTKITRAHYSIHFGSGSNCLTCAENNNKNKIYAVKLHAEKGFSLFSGFRSQCGLFFPSFFLFIGKKRRRRKK